MSVHKVRLLVLEAHLSQLISKKGDLMGWEPSLDICKCGGMIMEKDGEAHCSKCQEQYFIDDKGVLYYSDGRLVED